MPGSGRSVHRPLVWLGLMTLLMGVLVSYCLRQNFLGPIGRVYSSVSLWLSILLAGIMFILATQRWWFSR